MKYRQRFSGEACNCTFWRLTEQDLDTAFAALTDLRTTALVIGTYGFFDSQSGKLGAMAARLAIPAI